MASVLLGNAVTPPAASRSTQHAGSRHRGRGGTIALMRGLLTCIVAIAVAVPCSAEVEVLVGSPAGRVATEPDPARVNEPFAVAFDAAGRMYGVEHTRGNRLFRVGVDRTVEFVAKGFDGLHDVAVGRNGLVYLADTFNHRIRAFDPATGAVSVVAGTGTAGFGGDGGPATAAVFNQAYGGSLAPDGRLAIADSDNDRILAVFPAGGSPNSARRSSAVRRSGR